MSVCVRVYRFWVKQFAFLFAIAVYPHRGIHAAVDLMRVFALCAGGKVCPVVFAPKTGPGVEVCWIYLAFKIGVWCYVQRDDFISASCV